jgi:hypothetical protein
MSTPDPDLIQQWQNPEAPWGAKLRRARTHVKEIAERLKGFLNEEPWSIDTEPGRTPNESAYRLRVRKQVPADLLTVIGDAIHNMRSSLDSVAYEFARHHLGGQLTPDQEALTEFPIKQDGFSFDEWFTVRRRSCVRSELYGDREREALRCVQPFWMSEEAAEHGIDAANIREAEWNSSVLRRLHTASNIDKHRRLPLLTLFPDLVYWTDPADGSSFKWTPAISASAEFADGTLLGYLSDPKVDARPSVEIFHVMRLTLFDDSSNRVELSSMLESWLSSISGWIVPRSLIVAAGYARPIMIDGFWQQI